MMRPRLLPTPNAHEPEKIAMTREAAARLDSKVFPPSANDPHAFMGLTRDDREDSARYILRKSAYPFWY